MKLKAETEILENRIIQYQTKYLEIDKELMREIKEVILTKSQQLLFILWQKMRKGGENFKKNTR